jgi:hypothetical protein
MANALALGLGMLIGGAAVWALLRPQLAAGAVTTMSAKQVLDPR